MRLAPSLLQQLSKPKKRSKLSDMHRAVIRCHGDRLLEWLEKQSADDTNSKIIDALFDVLQMLNGPFDNRWLSLHMATLAPFLASSDEFVASAALDLVDTLPVGVIEPHVSAFKRLLRQKNDESVPVEQALTVMARLPSVAL